MYLSNIKKRNKESILCISKEEILHKRFLLGKRRPQDEILHHLIMFDKLKNDRCKLEEALNSKCCYRRDKTVEWYVKKFYEKCSC